ncbi:MAG: endonuclease V [Candidatus Helarchaeota archaeon]
MDRDELFRIAVDPNPDLDYLRAIQKKIAELIILSDTFTRPIKYIGGVDSAYFGERVITACIIIDWQNMKVIERKVSITQVKFPYISSFFVFREGAPILDVLSQIQITPSILLIESHGISHPVFAGCASHIGVLINLPTIGVAKHILCGTPESTPKKRGDWVPLKFANRVIGAYYLSQFDNKPIVISPGHRISLETAVKIVEKMIISHRLPEPLYLAHQLANQERAKIRAKN